MGFIYFEYINNYTNKYVDSVPFVKARVTHESFNLGDLPDELGRDDDMWYNLRYDRRKAVYDLERHLKKHPDNHVLLGWLSNCYKSIGQKRKAHALLEENYQKNPTELFPRCDYGVHQIKYHKNHKIVPSLLDETFNLHELYPGRDQFHVTEIMAFYQALGLYFVCEGDYKTAKLLVDTLKDIDCAQTEAVEDIEHALLDVKIKQAMRANR